MRRCHLLMLLALVVDLVNPVMPGVFSLVHDGLFMDGVTRARGTVASTGYVRYAARVPTSADRPRADVARAAREVAWGSRRAARPHDSRRASHPPVTPRATDTEDH
jgi:hypothetical protein